MGHIFLEGRGWLVGWSSWMQIVTGIIWGVLSRKIKAGGGQYISWQYEVALPPVYTRLQWLNCGSVLSKQMK